MTTRTPDVIHAAGFGGDALTVEVAHRLAAEAQTAIERPPKVAEHGAACGLYLTDSLVCTHPEEPHHRAARQPTDAERVAVVGAYRRTPDDSPTDTPRG